MNKGIMDLYCCETATQAETVTRAYDDPVLLEDSRVIENLLVCEDRYTITCCYFKCLQTELKPYMRTIVAEWMQEVCEEEGCDQVVFPLAVNCLDRFLSLVRVQKGHLQLLGAVCLFLASKLRQSRPITAERLCLHSDYSITISQIMDWELLVLSRLKWDISAITPFDFVNYILRRLRIPQGEDLVRRHAGTFISSICTIDVKFAMYPPSMIAAASIGAALQGLATRLEKHWSTSDLLVMLHEITNIDVDCLRTCWERIEASMISRIEAATGPLGPSSTEGDATPSHKLAEQQDQGNGGTQVGTPTDVQDIHF